MRTPLIALTLLMVLPSPARTATDIDADVRRRVVHSVAQHLREKYVFPDIGDQLAIAVERAWKAGAYNSMTGGEALAVRLTADLQALSRDQHLRVTYSAAQEVTPRRPAPSTGERRARITQLGGEINYGFRKVEILAGNIGYFALDGFWHLEFGGGDTAAATMAFLSRTDALIIDLRESSSGGDPEMSVLISSYLFPAQVHLSDFYSRLTNETRQWWTLAYVPGLRYIDKPVFILTSTKTFSAGEGFAYDLQAMKRAVVIGERTAGASHPEEEYVLTDGFAIELPFAQSINVVTKTDWEGTGVLPDTAVDAATALDHAQIQALTILMKQNASKRLRDERSRALADVQKRLKVHR